MGIIENRGITKLNFIIQIIPELVYQISRKIRGRRHYTREKYDGKYILKNGKGNNAIARFIRSNKPFMVARFGDGELRTTVYYIMRKLGIKKEYPQYIRTAICRNAGFFPNEEKEIDKFGELMLKSIQKVDILAVWFNFLEEYMYSHFGPRKRKCILLNELEPFWFEKPWSAELRNKKVLVIHPFAEDIENQYARRKHLFDRDILPDFDLITLKAVQSIGGRTDKFNNWFEALDSMYKEAMKMDFDIAIIGCGAYGLPLAAKIKEAGKQAIHMGGVTQFLFGIKGGRWDSRPEYSAFYNNYWCRPRKEDIPQAANEVENACYW